MRRKITVYGLRFSKTTFWNRLNTGFLDPAIATVLTACGIETKFHACYHYYIIYIATVLTACGIETYQIAPLFTEPFYINCNSAYRLRYWNQNARRCNDFAGGLIATVLTACGIETRSKKKAMVMMFILFDCNSAYRLRYWNLLLLKLFLVLAKIATVLTACGIETFIAYVMRIIYILQQCLPLAVLKHIAS